MGPFWPSSTVPGSSGKDGAAEPSTWDGQKCDNRRSCYLEDKASGGGSDNLVIDVAAVGQDRDKSVRRSAIDAIGRYVKSCAKKSWKKS